MKDCLSKLCKKPRNVLAILFFVMFLAAFLWFVIMEINTPAYVRQFNLFPKLIYQVYGRPFLFISAAFLLLFTVDRIRIFRHALVVSSKRIKKLFVVLPACLMIVYFVISSFGLMESSLCKSINSSLLLFLWEHSFLFGIFGFTTYFACNE